MNPNFPIYIITKGRWESRLTSKWLDLMQVPYHLVVEPSEQPQYAAVMDPSKILVAPEDFSQLKQGSIPVRNFVWEHSIESGAEWHWILDDNIDGFWRQNQNIRVRVTSGTIFKAAEDFALRYENVGQAGFNYYMFEPDRYKTPAYYFNTRVYSCILNRNFSPDGSAWPFRWRGRYNEDTDLSLRILKDGWPTILFNAFLAKKMPTLTMKGGNMEELYKGTESTMQLWEEHAKKCRDCGSKRPWKCETAKKILDPDGRWRMALSLYQQHPDVTFITRKWDRWQHQVDYHRFKKNRLVRKPGWKYSGVDNYGMRMVKFDAATRVTKEPTVSLRPAKPPPAPRKEAKPFDPDYWKKRGIGTEKPIWDTTNLSR